MHRPSYKITPNKAGFKITKIFISILRIPDFFSNYWYFISRQKPGSDVVGETAAALAAGSIAIKHVDPARSKLYLKHAIELFHFANKYRGKYSDCKYLSF